MADKQPNPPPAVAAATLARLHDACQSGDQDALLVWADALEEVGDTTAAALLRKLPRARDLIRGELAAWRQENGEGTVNLYAFPEMPPYWFLGDLEMGGDEVSDLIGPLLAGWNQFHPALEWLARSLGLGVAERGARGPGQRDETTTRYQLTSGQHFGPVPEGHLVTVLGCSDGQ